jgi:hypothetical protein
MRLSWILVAVLAWQAWSRPAAAPVLVVIAPPPPPTPLPARVEWLPPAGCACWYMNRLCDPRLDPPGCLR